MIVKGNQPSLLKAVTAALTGPDGDFAGSSWTQDGKGHGRRERRSIRTAPADGIVWPHAAQVFRIRRDSGPTPGSWQHKEIAYGITSLPAELAGPRHLATYTRSHWAVENRGHYVTSPSAKTPSMSAPGTSRTPTPPSATLSPAPSATPGSPISPTPAATTAATISASSPSTATPEKDVRHNRLHNTSAPGPCTPDPEISTALSAGSGTESVNC